MAIEKIFTKAVGAVAGATALIGVSAANVQAQDADITIRYGSNVTENMDLWKNLIEENGVSVDMQAGYTNPNCAVVIHNGEVKYSFTDKLIGRGKLSTVAEKLAKGERISKRTKSDCPVEVATLDN